MARMILSRPSVGVPVDASGNIAGGGTFVQDTGNVSLYASILGYPLTDKDDAGGAADPADARVNPGVDKTIEFTSDRDFYPVCLVVSSEVAEYFSILSMALKGNEIMPKAGSFVPAVLCTEVSVSNPARNLEKNFCVDSKNALKIKVFNHSTQIRTFKAGLWGNGVVE